MTELEIQLQALERLVGILISKIYSDKSKLLEFIKDVKAIRETGKLSLNPLEKEYELETGHIDRILEDIYRKMS
jgi:hypothetical protein